MNKKTAMQIVYRAGTRGKDFINFIFHSKLIFTYDCENILFICWPNSSTTRTRTIEIICTLSFLFLLCMIFADKTRFHAKNLNKIVSKLKHFCQQKFQNL